MAAHASPAAAEPFARLVHAADLDTWNRYAAVNDEFVAFHMDDAAARAIGFPAAFGMGNLLVAYAHEAVLGRLATGDVLEELELRFHQPAQRRTTVTVTATTGAATGARLELALSVDDEAGRHLASGSARVRRAGRTSAPGSTRR